MYGTVRLEALQSMICAVAFVWHAAYEQYRNISTLLIRRVAEHELRLLQLATSVRSSFKCHTHRHTQRHRHTLSHTHTQQIWWNFYGTINVRLCVCVCKESLYYALALGILALALTNGDLQLRVQHLSSDAKRATPPPPHSGNLWALSGHAS